MGFRGLLELLGITLEAPPVVILDEAICDIELPVASPDLLLAYDDAPWLVDLGDPLPLAVGSPDLLLTYDDEDLILVCPY